MSSLTTIGDSTCSTRTCANLPSHEYRSVYRLPCCTRNRQSPILPPSRLEPSDRQYLRVVPTLVDSPARLMQITRPIAAEHPAPPTALFDQQLRGIRRHPNATRRRTTPTRHRGIYWRNREQCTLQPRQTQFLAGSSRELSSAASY